jgi:hypothetical protein
MKLKFYSINMHLIINFSIPYILIIHKYEWSFNISNKTIYAELIESNQKIQIEAEFHSSAALHLFLEQI